MFFFVIPEDLRIAITYRNYPDLLKLYEANKENFSFFVIQRAYFNDEIHSKIKGAVEM